MYKTNVILMQTASFLWYLMRKELLQENSVWLALVLLCTCMYDTLLKHTQFAKEIIVLMTHRF